MLALAFLFSTIFSNSRTAIVFGYIYIFATGLLSSQIISSYLSNSQTPYGTIFGISIIPSFVLYRGISSLAGAVQFGGPGLKLTQLTSGYGSDLAEVYGYLVVESIIYFLLAIYFELVLPSGYGIKLSPIFCFKPSFWRRKRNHNDDQRQPPDNDEPEDVKEEREFAWDDSKENETVVRTLDLRKIYPGSNGNQDKVAVSNLSTTVRKGECFGLLGPNGSGKVKEKRKKIFFFDGFDLLLMFFFF